MSKHFAKKTDFVDYNDVIVELVGGIVRQAVWDYIEIGRYLRKKKKDYIESRFKKEEEKLKGLELWNYEKYGEYIKIYEDAKDFIFSNRLESIIGYDMANYIQRCVRGDINIYKQLKKPEVFHWSDRYDEGDFNAQR